MVQTLGSSRIFEGHRAVDIDNEDADKHVLSPIRTHAVDDDSNLDFLSNVILAVLNVGIRVVKASLQLGCFVAFFREN